MTQNIENQEVLCHASIQAYYLKIMHIFKFKTILIKVIYLH